MLVGEVGGLGGCGGLEQQRFRVFGRTTRYSQPSSQPKSAVPFLAKKKISGPPPRFGWGRHRPDCPGRQQAQLGVVVEFVVHQLRGHNTGSGAEIRNAIEVNIRHILPALLRRSMLIPSPISEIIRAGCTSSPCSMPSNRYSTKGGEHDSQVMIVRRLRTYRSLPR